VGSLFKGKDPSLQAVDYSMIFAPKPPNKHIRFLRERRSDDLISPALSKTLQIRVDRLQSPNCSGDENRTQGNVARHAAGQIIAL